MPILETPRLILRPFREEDVDLLAPLMGNVDFMRFSLGVYTHEQTAAFVEKLLGWQRANKPSLFAVILRSAQSKTEDSGTLLGYCGFYHQHIDSIDEMEIGYRIHHDYWNKGIGHDLREANYPSRVSDAGVFSCSRKLAGDAWRLMNSRARAR